MAARTIDPSRVSAAQQRMQNLNGGVAMPSAVRLPCDRADRSSAPGRRCIAVWDRTWKAARSMTPDGRAASAGPSPPRSSWSRSSALSEDEGGDGGHGGEVPGAHPHPRAAHGLVQVPQRDLAAAVDVHGVEDLVDAVLGHGARGHAEGLEVAGPVAHADDALLEVLLEDGVLGDAGDEGRDEGALLQDIQVIIGGRRRERGER